MDLAPNFSFNYIPLSGIDHTHSFPYFLSSSSLTPIEGLKGDFPFSHYIFSVTFSKLYLDGHPKNMITIEAMNWFKCWTWFGT